MTKQFRLWHPLILAYFSRDLYRDVGQRWRGIGLAYILLLVAACWLIMILRLQSGVNFFVEQVYPPIAKQIPVMTIKQGELSINKPSPYIIKDIKTGRPLIIFDINGEKYTSLNKSDSALALVTAHQIHFDNRTFPIKGRADSEITPEYLTHFLHNVRKWFSVVAYPVIVFVSYIIHLIEVIILALFGLILVAVSERKLDYIALLRLSAVCLTPAMVLDLVLSILGFHFPLQTIGMVLISLFYLFFAILANPKRNDGQANHVEPSI